MQLARAAFTALRHQQALAAASSTYVSRLFSSSSSCAAEQQHTTPEALREFRENVREFAQTVVAPHAEHVDKSNNFPTDVDLWREMGEFGLLGECAALHAMTCCTHPLSLPMYPAASRHMSWWFTAEAGSTESVK